MFWGKAFLPSLPSLVINYNLITLSPCPIPSLGEYHLSEALALENVVRWIHNVQDLR